MKRILLLLGLCFVLAALPCVSHAEQISREQAVIQEAKRVYHASQGSAGKASFSGYCGLMTSHQLYNMGINKTLIVKDGNKQFDYYRNLEKTDGGYYISAYSGSDYSLEQALNLITRDGTKDAYNILVGFQQTNTEAGAFFGHACVINAILDGTVYFVESFYTSLGGAEGNVICCSISEFAQYFDAWMVYEGLIHFGDYKDTCREYQTNVFLRARFSTTLRSQPGLLGRDDCVRLRSVAAGEVLQATALLTDRHGRMYYRVDGGEYLGYVTASAMVTLEVCSEDLSWEGLELPRSMEENQDPDIGGQITAQFGRVAALSVTVTDSKGSIILRERLAQSAFTAELGSLNERLTFDLLSSGSYTLEVSADAASTVAEQGNRRTVYTRTLLYSGSLLVGQAESYIPTSASQESVPHGWVRQNGTWYCYEQGTPLTGWVRRWGVDYYLDETGAVTVGWQEIDGKTCYFSPTGALCTGWLMANGGIYYLPEKGGFATGRQQIDGGTYFFGEDGLLLTDRELSEGDRLYHLGPDGRATE